MAERILADQKLWMGGYDFTGIISQMGLSYGAEMVDRSAFGSGFRRRMGGLKTVAMQHEGFFDGDPYDAALFANIGVSDVPASIAAEDASEGSVAFTFRALIGEYTPEGAVGDAFKFSVSADASQGPLVRGTLMHDAARTTSADGTGQQLGAVAADQSLYGALHVVSAAGTAPTLDVTVESDDNAGFTTAVTRLTFAQKAGIGSEWLSLAGPVTDDWWRVSWALGGTAPDFTFALILGIQ